MSADYSVHLVTWNSKRFLKLWFESIRRQTARPSRMIIVDNNSTDGTVEWIERHQPNVMMIRNSSNRGFSVGHNQAIEASNSPFHLVINPDILLSSNFCQYVLKAFDDRSVGAVGGKVFSLDQWPSSLEKISPQRLDTTGIVRRPWRQFIDRGQGEIDTGQYDDKQRVFGVSGALACYRRSALNDIRTNGEFFDEHFHSYKEDIDLAWRLDTKGWLARMVPEAVAYHVRAESGSRQSAMDRVKARPSRVAVQSYTNHLFMLVKNERMGTALLHLPLTFPYELLKTTLLLIRRPVVWGKSMMRIARLMKTMLSKRRTSVVQSSKRV